MSTPIEEALAGQQSESVQEPEAPQAEEPKVEQAPVIETPQPDPKMVPLAALIEEREKRKDLERLQQQAEAAKPLPDVLEAPEEFSGQLQQRMQQQLETQRLNISEQMARMHYGNEAVDAALAAFESQHGSAQHQAFLQDTHPFKALVEHHQSQSALQEMGGDPKAWMESQREAIRKELEAEMAVKQVKAPPPSMAAESNLGARGGPNWAGPTPLEDLIG